MPEDRNMSFNPERLPGINRLPTDEVYPEVKTFEEGQVARAIREAKGASLGKEDPLGTTNPFLTEEFHKDEFGNWREKDSEQKLEELRKLQRERAQHPETTPGRQYEVLALTSEKPEEIRFAINEFLNMAIDGVESFDQEAFRRMIADFNSKASISEVAAKEKILDKLPGLKSFFGFTDKIEVSQEADLEEAQRRENIDRELLGMEPVKIKHYSSSNTEAKVTGVEHKYTPKERKERAQFYREAAGYLAAHRDFFIANEMYNRARPSAGLLAKLAEGPFGSLSTSTLKTLFTLPSEGEKLALGEAVEGEMAITDMVDVNMRIYLLIMQGAGRKGIEDDKGQSVIPFLVPSREDKSRKVSPQRRMVEDYRASPDSVKRVARDWAQKNGIAPEDADVAFLEKLDEFAQKDLFNFPAKKTPDLNNMRDWVKGLTEDLSHAHELAEKTAWRFLFMTGLAAKYDIKGMQVKPGLNVAKDASDTQLEPFAYPVTDAFAKLMHYAANVHKETRRARDDGPDAIRDLVPANLITDWWNFTDYKRNVETEDESGEVKVKEVNENLWEDFYEKGMALKDLRWDDLGNGALYQWLDSVSQAGEAGERGIGGVADLLNTGPQEKDAIINDKVMSKLNTTINKLASAMSKKMLDQSGQPFMGGKKDLIAQRIWELGLIAMITSAYQDESRAIEGWDYWEGQNNYAELFTQARLKEIGVVIDWKFVMQKSGDFLLDRGFLTGKRGDYRNYRKGWDKKRLEERIAGTYRAK